MSHAGPDEQPAEESIDEALARLNGAGAPEPPPDDSPAASPSARLDRVHSQPETGLPRPQWLEPVSGPDGVRVTICVEAAVQRWVREQNQWSAATRSFDQAFRDAGALLVQRLLLRDRWAVVIEADSGERLRLVRPNRDEALTLAESVSASVTQRGVAALASVTT